MIEAAQALNCKPWELDTVPEYWQAYGRAYAQVKQGADLQLLREALKGLFRF